jgi:GTPase
MAQEVDEAGILMSDLPKEDDAGNVEYKLRLVNLTVEKVRSRTTQMYFRLKVSSGIN